MNEPTKSVDDLPEGSWPSRIAGRDAPYSFGQIVQGNGGAGGGFPSGWLVPDVSALRTSGGDNDNHSLCANLDATDNVKAAGGEIQDFSDFPSDTKFTYVNPLNGAHHFCKIESELANIAATSAMMKDFQSAKAAAVGLFREELNKQSIAKRLAKPHPDLFTLSAKFTSAQKTLQKIIDAENHRVVIFENLLRVFQQHGVARNYDLEKDVMAALLDQPEQED